MTEHTAPGTAPAPKTGPASPPFRALDPELPGLAARAAFELDNFRLRAEGKEVPQPHRNAIDSLATRLQSALRVSTPPVDRKALIDPLTTSVLRDAVIQSRLEHPTTLDAVLAEVGRLAARLMAIESFRQEIAGLTMLRDFCLALSDLASSKQRLIHSPPRPSYRGPKSPRL